MCIATALPAVAFAAAPTVSSFTPTDNATDVPVSTSTLSITFNQVVQGSGGTISLKRSSDNSLIEAIAVPDAQVTGSGTDTISIALTAPINEYNAGLYVQIDSGTFRNGAGEAYVGIADTTTWNFTTESLAAPAVAELTPADNSAAVSVNAQSLTIVFDKVVRGGPGNITVKKAGDDSVFEAIAANSGQVSGSGSTTVTVSLSASLSERAKSFYVHIASNAFHNIAGVFYTGIADTTTWNFTTEDFDSPTGGGSGKNYRRKLQALRAATSGSSGDLGIVELYSTAEKDTLSDSGELLESQVPDDEDDLEELSEDETEDETEDKTVEEDRSPTEPDQPSISVYKVEYKFKRRVCKRVASNFRLDEVMMERVNKRLHARFRFTCSNQGLPL
ncbi:hypothetical protein COU78_02420 [Candidatus Peregrinibacteria bacterium CG10_big_fil_rev_8_21_14_0_10_49_24]|nr:MAG: hypothetical protein COV83_02400 [Candidatus Peregrinibacteria bacterium CG11_big_fil_rev_8_21_14_0_20_49_14]PIR50992.1 MAG: hypothetical protein COU78_02420 [Candidatus Peregrinibacteria bacterium CG10_big_fil_rev_8_21_14_0_10_49_24]PJA67545.1 MAG: hypothetical protein CO157_03900 [Candidatus Peregrinibacteria bacterium CG_4_9_14_3_um_filter_49_12]